MRLFTTLLLLISLLNSSGLCVETPAPDARYHARAFVGPRTQNDNKHFKDNKAGEVLLKSMKLGFAGGGFIGVFPSMVMANTINGDPMFGEMRDSSRSDPGAVVVVAFGTMFVGMPLGVAGAVCGGVIGAAGEVALSIVKGKDKIQRTMGKHKFKKELKDSIQELQGFDGKIALSESLLTAKKLMGKSTQETIDGSLPCLRDGDYICGNKPFNGDVVYGYKYIYIGEAKGCTPEQFRCFDKDVIYELLGLGDKCPLKPGKKPT